MSNKKEKTARQGISFWSVISIAVLAFLTIFLAFPILRLLGSSLFSEDMSRVWDVYIQFVTKRYYRDALVNSIILTIAATAIATFFGTGLAYILARYRVRGEAILRPLIILTFISPPFIGAYSWILLFGRNGFITKAGSWIGIELPSIYGWTGTILVLGLQSIPLVYLMVSPGFRTIDQSTEDAAVNLGISPLKTFWTVTIPLMKPAISTGALLAALTAFTDIGTPAIIGQNLRVLPRLIYSEFANETGSDHQVASALSMVLLLFTIGALLVQRIYSRRHSYGHSCNTPLQRLTQVSKAWRLLVNISVWGIVLVAAVPILTVALSSVLRTQGTTFLFEFTFDGWLNAPRLWQSLGNTMFLATVATLIGTVVGPLIAYLIVRRPGRISAAIDFIASVPFAIAGVVLAIAISMTFGGAPFYLSGSFSILIIVYAIRRLPFSVRSSVAMLSQTGNQTEEASVNLGVPPGRTLLKITVPTILPAIVSGALLTWATLVREFNATIILYGSNTSTMSIEIFQQVLRGYFGPASVIATLLLLVSIVPILILFKLMGKDEQFLS